MEMTLPKLPVFMLGVRCCKVFVTQEIWLQFMAYKVVKHIFKRFLIYRTTKKSSLFKKILRKLRVQQVVNIYSEWLIKKKIKSNQINKKQLLEV